MYCKYFAFFADESPSILPLAGADTFAKACEMAEGMPQDGLVPWVYSREDLESLRDKIQTALGGLDNRGKES
jgi:hypothetical protein